MSKTKIIDTLEKFHDTGPAIINSKATIPTKDSARAYSAGLLLWIAYFSDRENINNILVHGFNDNAFEGNKQLQSVMTFPKNKKVSVSGADLFVASDTHTYIIPFSIHDKDNKEVKIPLPSKDEKIVARQGLVLALAYMPNSSTITVAGLTPDFEALENALAAVSADIVNKYPSKARKGIPLYSVKDGNKSWTVFHANFTPFGIEG